MKKLSNEKMSKINGGWSRLWWVPYYIAYRLYEEVKNLDHGDGNLIQIEDNLT